MLPTGSLNKVVNPKGVPFIQGQIPSASAVLLESQSVQQSLPLPGSDLHLVYHSSRAKGFLSTVRLQLTPSAEVEPTPAALRRVRLKITVEGVVHEKVFPAKKIKIGVQISNV